MESYSAGCEPRTKGRHRGLGSSGVAPDAEESRHEMRSLAFLAFSLLGLYCSRENFGKPNLYVPQSQGANKKEVEVVGDLFPFLKNLIIPSFESASVSHAFFNCLETCKQ